MSPKLEYLPQKTAIRAISDPEKVQKTIMTPNQRISGAEIF